ncbi:GNAT family N-acetyltransferase [Roseovarius aestuarii]|nr:GNAT family N-acetyltransferase [Roseovarius aestuarii]
MSFDAQPRLAGQGFTLTPLVEADRAGLTRAASDPEIWAMHPAKTRCKPQVFSPYFDMLLASASTLTVRDDATGDIIGCSRYYTAPDQPGTISIGFTFLTRPYWGGAANRMVKGLMLTHAFMHYPEVWFHIDPNNLRSQRATLKLGAEHAYDATLDLGGGGGPWKVYKLTQQGWKDTQ